MGWITGADVNWHGALKESEMQMVKNWWFTALLTVLLTLVSISHGSFAGYPLAALLWAEFFAWASSFFPGCAAPPR